MIMTDQEHYELLAAQLENLLKAGEFNSVYYRSLWWQAENLKQKHGGFPPPQEKPTTQAA